MNFLIYQLSGKMDDFDDDFDNERYETTSININTNKDGQIDEKIKIITVSKDFNKQYKQRFVRYTEHKSHPSDFWTFPLTEIIENIFSLAVGGYFWYMILGFIVVLLLNVLWSLVFNIPAVKNIFVNNNFEALFSLITFVASIFYIQILDYYRISSTNPLMLFKESTIYIKEINNSFNMAFNYELKALLIHMKNHELLNDYEIFEKKEIKILKEWYKTFVVIEKNVTELMFFMALFSLRVFMNEDYDFDYEIEYGIDRNKIKNLEKIVNRKRMSRKIRPKPEDFMETIIDLYESYITMIPLKINIEKMPVIRPSMMNNIYRNINNLKDNIHKSVLQKAVPEQRNFIFIRNLFVFFWIVVIIPFVAYDSVSTLLPLFGTMVEFSCVVPLINAWFIGKPFVYSGRYAGPDYFSWRKNLYRIINIDRKIREKKISKLKDIINGKVSDINNKI